MYQFFVDDEKIRGERIRITGEDVNHIAHVLRMKQGERIRISNRSGHAFFCHVDEITADYVTAVIDEPDELGTEFAHRVFLFQGLPKNDKMELIVQKAVELGVYEIVPVAMKRCVTRLDDKKASNKVRRWQAIAESAAKQAKRSVIPQVQMPVDWKTALEMAQKLDITLVPYENERGMAETRRVMQGIPKGADIGVMIGPEGGFAPEEIDSITGNMHRISLGRRILRTETAGLAALSMLIYTLDV